MIKTISGINVSVEEYEKIQDRAEKLAQLANKQKEEGTVINANEPIEGKMFWE